MVATFYSYKGGVGRSMALANVGALLAQWGYKTLVIDWDLEAPGLENFYRDHLNVEEAVKRNGLIDLLNLKLNDPEIDVERIPWREYIQPVRIRGNDNLSLLTAGKRDDQFVTRVKQFDFTAFYKTKDGGQFIEDIREYWIGEYKFVLIDSRTGLTDSSGICSIQMPDALILLFTPNEQSFNGIKKVASTAITKQKEIVYDRFELKTLPLPSRIENGETILLDQWMARICDESGEMLSWLPKQGEKLDKPLILPKQLFEKIRIPYKPIYAYGERLPVIERGVSDPLDLGYVYEVIAAILANEFQRVDLLVESRDAFVKRAKGESIDAVELQERLKTEAKVNLQAKDDLEFKIKVQEAQLTKRKKQVLRTVVGIAVVILGFFTILIWKDQTEKRQLALFKNLLTNIDTKIGPEKRAAICSLSVFTNDSRSLFINLKKDSLKKICFDIYETESIIKAKTNELSTLEQTASPETKKRGDEVDKIENSIMLTTIRINESKNYRIKQSYRDDSSRLELRLRSFLLSGDTLLSKIAESSDALDKASKKQESLLGVKNTMPVDSSLTNDGVLYKSTGWFKEGGYYLQFEEIKISLVSIESPANILVDIAKKNKKLYKGAVIKSGIPFSFSDDECEYLIYLDRVGKAGRNPFKPAAYITFERKLAPVPMK